MERDYKYKVVTLCMTYNQSSYIEETLRGFVIQETTFPVVYCIVDDASTDGEQDLLRRWAEMNLRICEEDVAYCKELSYGELVYARHNINSNAYFSILLLKQNHYRKKSKLPYLAEWIDASKYQAFCEGDDFWTHPHKMQMQVDFLESYPEYVMCHTDFSLSDGGYRNHNVFVSPDDWYFPYSLYHELQVGTLTTMLRINTYRTIPHLYVGKRWPMSDTPMWIEMSHEGKIKYLPIDTARYRVLADSASHGSVEKEIKFIEAAREIHQFYAQYYGVVLKNNGYSEGYYISVIKSAYNHNRPDVTKKYFAEAMKKRMLTWKTIVFAMATYIKPVGYLVGRLYTRKGQTY